MAYPAHRRVLPPTDAAWRHAAHTGTTPPPLLGAARSSRGQADPTPMRDVRTLASQHSAASDGGSPARSCYSSAPLPEDRGRLRRFISRRGLCEEMYSDCGTNFVGADRQLREFFRASSPDGRRIAQGITKEGVSWRFNPPAAPHFGGLWEAAVKSTKHHLRRVIGESTLTFEEMSTLLAQIEACLNSRPLQALSDDPDDLSALTPGHLLIGAPLLAIPEPSLADHSPNTLSRWQLLQRMRDHFWQRWSQEYLHALAPRSKWLKAEPAPEVGALCLIRSESTSPTHWPLARITRLHPGSDGTVRVVTVRTSTSEFVRPVVKLVLLPGVKEAHASANE
ncbi:uncharacterized protein LOC112638716 [Camponotus floridanus]|uniref:uncharacterized protein LOC112638716 n=1 Tax=Camponotus floridanus TaxID=104421 RepID=UPI000DC6C7D6|nr:uncharacterized protein LOC112638716 [Camponotus floridanus]